MSFSLIDLVKRLLKNSWWILILGIALGASLYTYAKHSVLTAYTAERYVIVAKDNTGVKDPNSRVQADQILINTYKKIASDPSVVNQAKKLSTVSVTKKEIVSAITVSQPDQTLMMRFSASAATAKKSVAIANAYARAFSIEGSKLYPDMAKPLLLSSAKKADVLSGTVYSPKKLTVFGFAFGITLGAFIVLLTGIFQNYKRMMTKTTK
ncbi:Wzz/FepE/Etk N-terminal domain-containing protein [Leuconostoc suionicum]|uniref:YveK family protein n=1 Tax=Leuconostoc suionicum TaxID=1511761 RepID=UPI0024AE7F7B|nr:Wzz/FepE/Etk N-terminal domain-containing protein [Leuconostoc suionicum]MDI6498680.1 Wzz/FepE/Etk N-terminal domain-containing protein [Leuconostoc suionicum]MDI6500722.1 Wzz/FepE/Etk N-terminal domain-containing protein [Leuconostoc suionicum]MDI6502846.1 Wzz/FepE/Etk N-terminal domain-containing protein [Leuconostoc suionicum]MDI6521972.1 Wzz/FepE/Etk N-terminal domain-containing protein [Leuconostoc suionicum]MDI6550636.1 Wzz/FepE/Etk N-terminal domain-containing protein [Leuconostoc su